MNLEVIKTQINNLLLAYPELADDEILRADMVEGSTDVHEFLRMLERRRQEAECLTEAVAINISMLGERKARMCRREEAMRDLMLKVMQAADVRKVELPECTVSIRNGTPKIVITDEKLLPDIAWRIKREPDKIKIKQLLEKGPLDGAHLSNAEPVLSIRVR